MKKTVKIKESELRTMIERFMNEQEVEEPEIMEPEVDPGIKIDKPSIPEPRPGIDPFTPRRINPGQEPQPRARRR